MKVVEFYQKEVYGNTMLYIADPDIRRTLTRLTGKKTIDTGDIENLQTLGLRFKQVMPPLEGIDE